MNLRHPFDKVYFPIYHVCEQTIDSHGISCLLYVCEVSVSYCKLFYNEKLHLLYLMEHSKGLKLPDRIVSVFLLQHVHQLSMHSQ